MEHKKVNASTLAILFLSIAFVVMSVGFAAYAQTLNINGIATIKKALWKVQFQDNSYVESAGSVAASSKSLNATTFTYGVTLKPGEFYEATVDVENAGTFDATLKSITMSNLTDEQKEYVKYTVTYDSTDYTATTENLSNDLPAPADESTTSEKKCKVRVEYYLPEDPSKLPTEADIDLTLTATLNYVQKV